jgi:uncharacterized protein YxeA
MKKVMALVISVLFVFAVSSFSFAAENAKADEAAPAKVEKKETSKKEEGEKKAEKKETKKHKKSTKKHKKSKKTEKKEDKGAEAPAETPAK